MTSRERLLTAINNGQPDRVPICFRNVAPLEHLWTDQPGWSTACIPLPWRMLDGGPAKRRVNPGQQRGVKHYIRPVSPD
jgi:hypothetical protein